MKYDKELLWTHLHKNSVENKIQALCKHMRKKARRATETNADLNSLQCSGHWQLKTSFVIWRFTSLTSYSKLTNRKPLLCFRIWVAIAADEECGNVLWWAPHLLIGWESGSWRCGFCHITRATLLKFSLIRCLALYPNMDDLLDRSPMEISNLMW